MKAIKTMKAIIFAVAFAMALFAVPAVFAENAERQDLHLAILGGLVAIIAVLLGRPFLARNERERTPGKITVSAMSIRFVVGVFALGIMAVALAGCDSPNESSRTASQQSSTSENLPRDSGAVPPVRRNSGTENELAKCENLARQKGVQLSGGLNTRDLGGEMHHYSANASYRGNSCQFICLFWGGEMDSAICRPPYGKDAELFCANPPCFR